MSNLTAFLAQNAIKVEVDEHEVSKRFVEPVLDENGKQEIDKKGKPITKPVKWKVGAVTSDEDEQLRKQHTKRLPVPGKKNMFQPTTDFDAYLATLAVRCTLFPDLHNKELQDSYKVMDAESLLKKMLLPGEYADYLKFIQNKNGFDVGMEETVEEAKN
ncbi:phage tail assembly chaperone [Bacillus sp. FJAT-22090]|uniref:phage tail assembly chaperone n=1 Tax=Bacillus sp. FJAT-22090 TaxID=1581038 RepID=UPI0011A0536E|nr:phage portal protein [Bacillus sp. FJAT-22090]